MAELISKNETCTYRYLIYDLLGFDGYYSTLISGLTITNALVEKEDLQQKVKQLEKENEELKKQNKAVLYALTLVRQKWNNDKPKYRRKASKYRQQRNQLENIRKEAIEWIEHNQYYFPRPYDLLNILNKGIE